MHEPAKPAGAARPQDIFLFWACFIALIATAFGFIVRTQIIDDWGRLFNLTDTQKGEIFGVGLWPFAVSIVLFSLIIDRIGYGKAMAFAFVCHVSSAIITIFAEPIARSLAGPDGNVNSTAYWVLYVGTFIVALGNGTVEAVINPVVATVFRNEKTKWLSFLHAGWPGGLVLGGMIAIGMGAGTDWRYKVALIFIPVILYGLMMLRCKFPQNERVAAGVSYKTMLSQVGFFGAFIITGMIVFEVFRVFTESGLIFKEGAPILGGLSSGAQLAVKLGLTFAVALGFGATTGSLGQPLFIFLLLIMIPLATTELGTDSWITSLMEPEMEKLGQTLGVPLQGGWVLIYTSLIMLILRFCAGPIVHALSPLGLLAVSALLAACGLVFLSKATGLTILLAATVYGLGKTFFWPSMLGVVSEQFPQGGALTLNGVAGVGMLAVGVLGNPLLGNLQDRGVDTLLKERNPALHAEVIADQDKFSIFGTYRPIDQKKLEAVAEVDKEKITEIENETKKSALTTVAIFPCIMLACYLGLIGYFRAKGGYKPVNLISEKEEALLMSGGATGPDEF
jgi:MFS family permease